MLLVTRNRATEGASGLSGPEEQGQQDRPQPCKGRERLREAPHGTPMQSGPQEASTQTAPDEGTEERSRGPLGMPSANPAAPLFQQIGGKDKKDTPRAPLQMKRPCRHVIEKQ